VQRAPLQELRRSGRLARDAVTTIQIVALIVSLTAVLAYINARWIRLPPQIGMLAIALAGSLAVVVLDALGVVDAARVREMVGAVDFGPTLVHGMLGLLLFAGSLHVPLDTLTAQRWPIAALSLGATVVSTVLVGAATYAAGALFGQHLDWFTALLFGAVVSPTDPIAVLGVLKRSRVPADLAVQITGESLFNDGVGVVVFTVLVVLGAGGSIKPGEVAWLFVQQVAGGAAFGFALGYLLVRMLRVIDDGSVEVLVTLGLVLGGYAAAEALRVSAPIAAVVAGVMVGNRPAKEATEHARVFWELVDEILNAVLFLALGLEATRLRVSSALAISAAVAIPIVLASRLASVSLSLAVLRPFKQSVLSRHTLAILTWGGLRGGLAVALALSLPPGGDRDALLVMTYAVVAFAILVQGLTFGPMLRKLGLSD
jgi:CPA1 family monovalent cation:H+ antiporter